MPDLTHETALRAQLSLAPDAPVAGIDEVGRGPCAGPVLAAAVILPPGGPPGLIADALDDSKKVPVRTRERLFEALTSGGAALAWALGEASVAEIDRLNILQAAMLAMRRAVAGLGVAPAAALVDGNRDPGLDVPAQTLVKGDGRSLSIAAASILAKVARDRLMADLAETHPGYGWERNAGYGSWAHLAAIERLGVTEHHRRSFAPVRRALEAAAGPL